MGRYCATGMHGGTLYVRGDVPGNRVAKGIAAEAADQDDRDLLRELLTPYCGHFGLSVEELVGSPFIRLVSTTTRPYGQLYAY